VLSTLSTLGSKATLQETPIMADSLNRRKLPTVDSPSLINIAVVGKWFAIRKGIFRFVSDAEQNECCSKLVLYYKFISITVQHYKERCQRRLCLLVLHEVTSSDDFSVLFSVILTICRF